ncbi:MAG: amidohydrolase family protein, partial [Acidobacteria bacterium]|nr:amidohydrolase family protein [Acidobacteriota bacterium]
MSLQNLRNALSLLAVLAVACGQEPHDVLIHGGLVYDGGGGDPVTADIAVTGDRISFIGDADAEGLTATETVDAAGLIVAPGFIDMHAHSQIGEDWAKEALPFLYQGITTVVLGVDGGGSPDVNETLAGWEASGIGVNALTYVGHGAVRRLVLGEENRAPTDEELDRMRALVRKGLEEGAFGLSSGL